MRSITLFFVLIGLSLCGCSAGFTPSRYSQADSARSTNQVPLVPSGANGPTPTPIPLAAGEAPLRFTCKSPALRGTSESRMRRLTTLELVATLTDLLGVEVVRDAEIQVQLKTLPADEMSVSFADVAPDPAAIQAATMFNIAKRAAELALASTSARDRIFGACAASPSASCVRTFATEFGKKIRRRPLAEIEITSLVSLATTVGGNAGMSAALMRLLMSPSLVFHLETEGVAQGARIRLSDFEVASRLSYRIAGTMPDSQLLEAAASGKLKSLQELRAQAKRLLSSNGWAREKVAGFFRYYTQSALIGAPYAPAGSLNGIDTTGLQAELARETQDFVDNVVWTRNGKFKDLLTSDEVFPRSERMAKILEASRVTGSAPSKTNAAHAGLLLRPALFANGTSLTKPYHRAAVIRKGYLCEPLGAPDPGLLAEAEKQAGDLAQLGNRERLTILTSGATCKGCHALLNPIAFVLEGYDQLGVRRSVETNFDSSGRIVGTHPIDTSVTGTKLADENGSEIAALSDAIDLARAVARGGKARACFAQRILEFQQARANAEADECLLNEIEASASDNGTIADAFVNAVANEDIFWRSGGNDAL